MRTPILIGNWKLNKTIEEAVQFFTEMNAKYKNEDINVDFAIAAPNLTFFGLMTENDEELYIPISAQNVSQYVQGAYTGETSVKNLEEIGVDYALIGHSERREYFGETNETVNAKLKTVLRETEDIIPVMAYGEKLEVREAGKAFDLIREQLTEGLKDLTKEEVATIVIAYEPIWAIGTGVTASPAQAEEACKFSREVIAELYDQATADEVRIQYGGSVTPDNFEELLSSPNIDGGLVGGASLKAESFMALLDIANK